MAYGGFGQGEGVRRARYTEEKLVKEVNGRVGDFRFIAKPSSIAPRKVFVIKLQYCMY